MSNLVVANGQPIGQLATFDRHTAIQVAVEKRNALVEFVQAIMKEGIDYGAIPGTDKPTLLKPGAEKLCTLFGYLPAYEIVEKSEDWTGKDHSGEPFFFYHYRCKVADQSGRIIATGEGSVNSWEKKYRYRDAKPVCPHCGQMTVNRSKKPQEGFYCWAKIGGCGATFPDRDPVITSQPVGKMPNPDIFDQVNTMMKMAQKRALVACVLLACNASEFFTQDLEDLSVIDAEIVSSAPPRPQPVQTQVQLQQPTSPEIRQRLEALMQHTGHTQAQVFTIAAKNQINPDSMTEDEYLKIRDFCLADWAMKFNVFNAKKHAWNAFKSIINPSVEFYQDDEVVIGLWQSEIDQRVQDLPEAELETA